MIVQHAPGNFSAEFGVFQLKNGVFSFGIIVVFSDIGNCLNDDPLPQQSISFFRGQFGLIDREGRLAQPLALALERGHYTIGRISVAATNHGHLGSGDSAHPARPLLDFAQNVGRQRVA